MLYQFIAGLADSMLRQEILKVEDLTLVKALNMAIAKENAMELSYSQQYGKCKNCGEMKHKNKSECPAKDNKCPCGKSGHFNRLCFSKGKNKMGRRKKKVATLPIQSPNFSDKKSEPDSSTLKTVATDGAILPGTTLASLQFGSNNNEWVDNKKEAEDFLTEEAFAGLQHVDFKLHSSQHMDNTL